MKKTNNNFFLVILILLTALGVFCIYTKQNADKQAKQFYKQGLEFYNSKKYQDSYYNFSQIKKYSNLYELSLLKEYQCARNLGDKKTAYLKLSSISKISKNQYILPYALYYEIELGKELKSYTNSQLIKKYKYLIDNFPQSDFSTAAKFKYAQLINETNAKEAKNYYIDYLEIAPTGKYSTEAQDALYNYKDFLSEKDIQILAYSHLQKENYSKALELYEKTNFEINWANIARAYKGLNNKEKEQETIIKGLDLNYSTVEEKELSAQIDRLISISNSNKIQTLQNLYTKYPKSYIFPTVTYKLAENSNSIRSYKLYELIADNYPNSIWASNSIWEMFWQNYQLKRYKTCEMLAHKHYINYPQTQDAPRIAYWRAKVLLKAKKQQRAKDIFYDVISEYPTSYYAFLSARQLKLSKANKLITKKQILSYDIKNITKFLFEDKMLKILAQTNDSETIDDLKIDDEFVKSWVMHKKENYSQSILIAKKALLESLNTKEDKNEEEKTKSNFGDYRLKLIYPILFEEEINKHAKKYELSPYLYLSLIREESHFANSAKSSVGAMGLAQIMPATANFIENKPVSKETLLTPNENIRIGAKYFRYLIDYFKGNEMLAIVAYNAGPGNINKWLNNSSVNTGDIDEFVENIPFLETKNYIKKILSTYWTYVNIYSIKK